MTDAAPSPRAKELLLEIKSLEESLSRVNEIHAAALKCSSEKLEALTNELAQELKAAGD